MKKADSFSWGYFLAALILFTSSFPGNAFADIIIDNGGSGTSSTGTWAISGATGSYGSNSVWSRDGVKYKWSFTPTISGNYQVSMWWTIWPSRSRTVPVDIRHSGGTARITINQQLNGGKWNILGTYSLIGGVTCTVTVTSQPGPSSTCADAVRFAYLGGGGNQPPVANDDSAATAFNTPVTITVIANDTDDVGINAASVAIVAPPANGTAVPNGNGTVTYSPIAGFTGVNTFRYTVADGQGAMSNQATVTVTVYPEQRAKHVILMVPDGMGLSNVTAARIFFNGPSGNPLSFESLEEIGYQRTYSENNTITDSAPASSAWACGEKFSNGEICFHGDGRPNPSSLLELSRIAGMATGLVATSTVTDATPAAFGAKVQNRHCEKEIARQYVHVTTPDVILGGGADIFRSTSKDPCGVSGDFIAEAQGKGYVFVDTKAAMEEAVTNGAWKVLGLFSPAGMTPEYVRPVPTAEPRLPEMTKAALDLLSRNNNGFFLMVEGSQIDSANHANDINYLLGEMRTFDEAVAVVRSWIDADPDRRLHTLLVVLADHETGGFALNGPAAGLAGPGEALLAGWTTNNHTGTDVPIWSEGPGSVFLGRAIENTDVYHVLKNAMKIW